MDDIHIKSDISYEGGKLVGSNLNPDDPTKTVFAIMISSLHKKWSCLVRLLPCASPSAEKIYSVIQSCIVRSKFWHILPIRQYGDVISTKWYLKKMHLVHDHLYKEQLYK